jgi:hypothetical protein
MLLVMMVNILAKIFVYILLCIQESADLGYWSILHGLSLKLMTSVPKCGGGFHIKLLYKGD